MPPPDPLILTLALDEAAQARFDDLRRAYFPPERNHLSAHVTLFHALPGADLAAVRADVACAAARPAFAVDVTGLRLLGRGVAYVLRSGELDALHAELAARWRNRLGAQDRQPLRAHVTVQNKVSAEQARATYARLAAAFTPATVRAEGLRLWHYRGGPWALAAAYRFDTAAG